MNPLFLFTFLIVSSALVVLGTSYPYDQYSKHPLREISTLVLYNGKFTTGRRTSPVPQMACVGGDGRQYQHRVESIHCHNSGFDGRDVIWRCEADIPKFEQNGFVYQLRLGKVEVSCEGYDYPDDPFILVGSCGLEYTLNMEQVGPAHNNVRVVPTYSHDTVKIVATDGDSSISSIGIFFIIVFIIIGVSMCIYTPSTSTVTSTRTTYTAPRTSTTTRTTYTSTRTPASAPETPETQTPIDDLPAPTPAPAATHTHTHTRETVHVPVPVSDSGSAYRRGYNDANWDNVLMRPRQPVSTAVFVSTPAVQPTYVVESGGSGFNSMSSGDTKSTSYGTTKRRG